MCGYDISGNGEFIFNRENGESFDFTSHGPNVDETGSPTKYFAYINSGEFPHINNTSTMEMPMKNALNHIIECFHFWFYIKVNNNIQR